MCQTDGERQTDRDKQRERGNKQTDKDRDRETDRQTDRDRGRITSCKDNERSMSKGQSGNTEKSLCP